MLRCQVLHFTRFHQYHLDGHVQVIKFISSAPPQPSPVSIKHHVSHKRIPIISFHQHHHNYHIKGGWVLHNHFITITPIIMTMWARRRILVKVVELLVQEEAVLLDVKNKNGLKPEEVTQDSRIKELLREEHWRRARSEVCSWHLMTKGSKLLIWCWCLSKTLSLIQRWGERQSFWSNKNDEKLRCLFLLSSVSSFIYGTLFYIFSLD